MQSTTKLNFCNTWGGGRFCFSHPAVPGSIRRIISLDVAEIHISIALLRLISEQCSRLIMLIELRTVLPKLNYYGPKMNLYSASVATQLEGFSSRFEHDVVAVK